MEKVINFLVTARNLQKMKKNNIVREILNSLTPEENFELERQGLESEAYQRWLEENGYEWNTPKSISIKILKDNGFNPIGITCYGCEETFIFNTREELNRAHKKCQNTVDGWWYTKRQAKENNIEYETV